LINTATSEKVLDPLLEPGPAGCGA